MADVVALAIVHRNAERPLVVMLCTAYRKLPACTSLALNRSSPLSINVEVPGCSELVGSEVDCTVFTVTEPSVAPEPVVPLNGMKLYLPNVLFSVATMGVGSVGSLGP